MTNRYDSRNNGYNRSAHGSEDARARMRSSANDSGVGRGVSGSSRSNLNGRLSQSDRYASSERYAQSNRASQSGRTSQFDRASQSGRTSQFDRAAQSGRVRVSFEDQPARNGRNSAAADLGSRASARTDTRANRGSSSRERPSQQRSGQQRYSQQRAGSQRLDQQDTRQQDARQRLSQTRLDAGSQRATQRSSQGAPQRAKRSSQDVSQRAQRSSQSASQLSQRSSQRAVQQRQQVSNAATRGFNALKDRAARAGSAVGTTVSSRRSSRGASLGADGRALPVFFVGVVALLLVLFILLPDSDFSDTENRQLQTLPSASLSSYIDGSLQAEITSYVEDQFPLRDAWVTVRSVAAQVLGRVENNGVYLAANDTLIQEFVAPADNSAADAIVSFTRTYPDLKVYTMIAPTAAGIWRDRLPGYVVSADQQSYLANLAAQFTSAGASNIDLWSLFEANKDQALYYRTDHHWTSFGAYLAYKQFAQVAQINVEGKSYNDLVMTNDFKGSLSAEGGYLLAKADSLSVYIRSDRDVPCVVTYVDEKEKSSSPFVSSALDKRDAYQVFLGGNHSLVQLDCYCEDSRGTLLVVKDSYANCFIPFLIEDYEKIIVVDPRYYTETLSTLVSTYKVNDVLFLYNATTFAQDTSLARLVNAG